MTEDFPSKCTACGEQSHFGRCTVPGTRENGKVYIGPVKRKGKVVRAGYWRQMHCKRGKLLDKLLKNLAVTKAKRIAEKKAKAGTKRGPLMPLSDRKGITAASVRSGKWKTKDRTLKAKGTAYFDKLTRLLRNSKPGKARST